MKILGVKQNKKYVSEFDQFLQDFDKKCPLKSDSQKETIEKHRKIAERRDKSRAR